MAYRFQFGGRGRREELATSLRYFLALFMLVVPVQSSADDKRLLEPLRPAALPERFAAAMTRARLDWFIRGPKPLSVAFDHAASQPSTIPFFWEAGDGSTIRRMPDAGFRMEIWSAATNWTSYVFCEPAGWPAYFCSDNSLQDMSAPDISTVIFAGRTFTRRLPGSDAVDLAIDEPEPAHE